MKNSKLRRVAFLLVSAALGASGQLFFKVGITSGVTVYFLTYIAVGVMTVALGTIVYLYVLSTTHLSWAYGFAGLGYILAGILAFAFLGEQIPPLKWFGIVVVSLGTLMVGAS